MTKPKKPRSHHQQLPSKQAGSHGQGKGKKHRKMRSFSKLSTNNNNNGTSNNSNSNSNNNSNTAVKGDSSIQNRDGQSKQQQHRRPIVPFRRRDRILLIGEGDFSFAHTLVTYHRCRDVLATCYDSQETLYRKYPQVEKNIADILAFFSTNSRQKDEDDNDDDDEESTFVESPRGHQQQQHQKQQRKDKGPQVLFSVDARKLGSAVGGGKDIRMGYPRTERKRPAWQEAAARKKESHASGLKETGRGRGGRGGPWDIICFNFPHVGGLSTDVNRQVRANQELLVSFFKTCVPLLSAHPEPVSDDDDFGDEWESTTESEDGSSDEGSDDNNSEKGVGGEGGVGPVKAKRERRTEPGQILVTLFEGEPYTLWNIRDLARHAGLRVVTSFRFPWACYRGYSHARTLGEIETKEGGRGGWKGEDREARTYVFEVKTDDHGVVSLSGVGKRKKRPAETDESESD